MYEFNIAIAIAMKMMMMMMKLNVEMVECWWFAMIMRWWCS